MRPTVQSENTKRSPGRRKKDTRNLWSFHILVYVTITALIVCASAYASVVFGGYFFHFDLKRPLEIADGLRLGIPYDEMRSKLAPLQTTVVQGDKVGKIDQDGVLYTLRFTNPEYGEKIWQISYTNDLKNMSPARLEKDLAFAYGLPTSVDCYDKINCVYTFFLPFTLLVVKTTQHGNDIHLNVTATDIYYGAKK